MEEALCFGWIDSQVRKLDDERLAQLMTPRKRGSGWARTNKVRLERLEAQGLLAPAGIAMVEAAKADGSWTLLDAVEDLIVPADLQAALAARPGALVAWEGFPASPRKVMLTWVVMAKTASTRERRRVRDRRARRGGRARGPGGTLSAGGRGRRPTRKSARARGLQWTPPRADLSLMQILPRLCCAELDAMLASPLPPRLVICPLDERLLTVADDGSPAVEHLDCPACGAPLPWVQARLTRAAAPASAPAAPPRPQSWTPVPAAGPRIAPQPGDRFAVRAAGREATGIVIGVGPQAVTALVALWLGPDRDPEAGDPDVLAVTPAWPLNSGAWPIVGGGERARADALRDRGVVVRRDPQHRTPERWFGISAAMELSPIRSFDELPIRPCTCGARAGASRGDGAGGVSHLRADAPLVRRCASEEGGLECRAVGAERAAQRGGRLGALGAQVRGVPVVCASRARGTGAGSARRRAPAPVSSCTRIRPSMTACATKSWR